uniref:Uncharacterized protein n=1 Tax=Aureoumbra lagunensis TaxID=44058 RepID=A0A7S3JWU1_9STRA
MMNFFGLVGTVDIVDRNQSPSCERIWLGIGTTKAAGDVDAFAGFRWLHLAKSMISEEERHVNNAQDGNKFRERFIFNFDYQHREINKIHEYDFGTKFVFAGKIVGILSQRLKLSADLGVRNDDPNTNTDIAIVAYQASNDHDSYISSKVRMDRLIKSKALSISGTYEIEVKNIGNDANFFSITTDWTSQEAINVIFNLEKRVNIQATANVTTTKSGITSAHLDAYIIIDENAFVVRGILEILGEIIDEGTEKRGSIASAWEVVDSATRSAVAAWSLSFVWSVLNLPKALEMTTTLWINDLPRIHVDGSASTLQNLNQGVTTCVDSEMTMTMDSSFVDQEMAILADVAFQGTPSQLFKPFALTDEVSLRAAHIIVDMEGSIDTETDSELTNIDFDEIDCDATLHVQSSMDIGNSVVVLIEPPVLVDRDALPTPAPTVIPTSEPTARPTFAVGTEDIDISGTILISGIFHEQAQANEIVFRKAIADVSAVYVESVLVTLESTAPADSSVSIFIGYIVTTTSPEQAAAVVSALTDLTFAEMEAAISTAAEDSGVLAIFLVLLSLNSMTQQFLKRVPRQLFLVVNLLVSPSSVSLLALSFLLLLWYA